MGTVCTLHSCKLTSVKGPEQRRKYGYTCTFFLQEIQFYAKMLFEIRLPQWV